MDNPKDQPRIVWSAGLPRYTGHVCKISNLSISKKTYPHTQLGLVYLPIPEWVYLGGKLVGECSSPMESL